MRGILQLALLFLQCKGKFSVGLPRRGRDFLRLPRLPRRGAERFGKIQDQTDRFNRLDCRELPVCFFCSAETCLETFERRTAQPITGWRELVGSLIVYLWSNYAGKGIENWIPEVSNTENAEAVFGLKIWCGKKKKKKRKSKKIQWSDKMVNFLKCV